MVKNRTFVFRLPTSGSTPTGCFGRPKCRSGHSRRHSIVAAFDPKPSSAPPTPTAAHPTQRIYADDWQVGRMGRQQSDRRRSCVAYPGRASSSRPSDAFLQEPPPPFAYGMLVHAQLGRDVLAGQTVATSQDDPALFRHRSCERLSAHLPFEAIHQRRRRAAGCIGRDCALHLRGARIL
jgi:hypothetical protein